jgi:hypothetical protein
MWAEAIATIALLAQFPDIKEKWQNMGKKTGGHGENEAFMLALYKEQLTTRVISYELVVGFSKEHSMPTDLVEYCRAAAKNAREELERLKATLAEDREP